VPVILNHQTHLTATADFLRGYHDGRPGLLPIRSKINSHRRIVRIDFHFAPHPTPVHGDDRRAHSLDALLDYDFGHNTLLQTHTTMGVLLTRSVVTACPPAAWRKFSLRTPDVAECAVFGVNDKLKGEIPVGLLVLKSGVMRDPGTIVNEVVQMVRDTIGPVASFKIAVVVERLPKTRSGKILRATMQKIANGDLYATPATIDDPAVLAEIETAMAHVGYAKSKLQELRNG
jgi:AMP-binding enzyme C-terminal domain